MDNLVVMLHQVGSSGITILASLTCKIVTYIYMQMNDELIISSRLLGLLEDILGYV